MYCIIQDDKIIPMKKKHEKTINVNLPGITPLRKLSRTLNFETLKPAIVDGIAQFKVGDELVLRRDHLKDKKFYLCTVVELHENGDVNLRNDTLGQCVLFNVKNPMNVKLR